MKSYRLLIALVVTVVCLIGMGHHLWSANAASSTRIASARGTIPFIENVGQFAAGARFRTQTEYGTLFLAENALWVTALEDSPSPSDVVTSTEEEHERPIARGGVNLRLSFVGANPQPTIEAFDPLTTSVNYFYGNDPAKWYTHVPVWGGLRYKDLYPGIDLELTSDGSRSVQRLVVEDGYEAQLADVQLQIEGADAVSVTADSIVVTTAKGVFRLPLLELSPSVNATLKGDIGQVKGTVVSMPFQTNTLNNPLTLPGAALLPSNLLYSTFLGGSEGDEGRDVVSDRYGAIYVTGSTESLDFPTTPGVFDPLPNQSEYAYEGFVTKLNPSGTNLEYSTYVHGNDSDYLKSIAVDNDGAVYVTGQTYSNDFPTTPNPPAPGPGGTSDGFIFKLTPNGAALQYSFYLGGTDTDVAEALALQSDKTVTIVGTTASTDFPTTPNAYDRSYNGYLRDVFVTRVSADGSTLLYSTYLGGSNNEEGKAVAVDAGNSTYVMGFTASDNFPVTPGAYDTEIGFREYFVTKLTPDGSQLSYSTFVGGSPLFSYQGGIAVDRFGAAYVTTSTSNDDFPATPGAFDPECGAGGEGCSFSISDGVLFKLNATGSDLVYGTYLGGREVDTGAAVAVDYDGNAYVLGTLFSTDHFITPGGYAPPESYWAGIWKISADGSTLLHLSRTPGEASQGLYLEAPDVILYTDSVLGYYETTPGAYDTTINGTSDVGVGRMVLPAASTSITLTLSSGTLTSVVDGTEYTLAPNTFTDTVVLTHAPRHRLSLPPITPRVAVGHTFVNYAIASDGTTSLQPTQRYHLKIAYNPATLGATEASLRLYFWNGTAWEIEPTMQLFTDQNTITADPDRLGWWIVSASPHYHHLPIIRH